MPLLQYAEMGDEVCGELLPIDDTPHLGTAFMLQNTLRGKIALAAHAHPAAWAAWQGSIDAAGQLPPAEVCLTGNGFVMVNFFNENTNHEHGCLQVCKLGC